MSLIHVPDSNHLFIVLHEERVNFGGGDSSISTAAAYGRPPGMGACISPSGLSLFSTGTRPFCRLGHDICRAIIDLYSPECQDVHPL